MNIEGKEYHELIDHISQTSSDMQRAIMSLKEELEAVDCYSQRTEVLVFIGYQQSLYKPLRKFTKYYIKMTKAMACNERIESVMAIAPCDLGGCEKFHAETLHSFKLSKR